jgi:hypothetical protein
MKRFGAISGLRARLAHVRVAPQAGIAELARHVRSVPARLEALLSLILP